MVNNRGQGTKMDDEYKGTPGFCPGPWMSIIVMLPTETVKSGTTVLWVGMTWPCGSQEYAS